jgi:glycosyltransferase involved in cell wall biosynthesis
MNPWHGYCLIDPIKTNLKTDVIKAMKVIVQIPCFNEETTLPLTIKDIPSKIEGVDSIEILIVDDGSTDKTVEVAKKLGVNHIVSNVCNKGLAYTYVTALDACLRLGADIIVNTDGDNQYKGQDIPKLIAPILRGEAELVVGDRQTDSIEHFSRSKKGLQRVGSSVVRFLSGTDIRDAVSGFRAISRKAAMRMNIVTGYSYTVESIIQAGKKGLAVTSVPIGTNGKTRESRLVKSIPRFVSMQINTMVRMYTMYQPLRVFFLIGMLFIITGMIPSLRFVYYYISGTGSGHIQSLILASILFIVGFQILVLGLIGDVISFNRRLIEETLLRVRRIEFDYLGEKRTR